MACFEYVPKYTIDDFQGKEYSRAELMNAFPKKMSIFCFQKILRDLEIEPINLNARPFLYTPQSALKLFNAEMFRWNWNIKGYVPINEAAKFLELSACNIALFLRQNNVEIITQKIGIYSRWVKKSDLERIKENPLYKAEPLDNSFATGEMIRLKYLAARLGRKPAYIRYYCDKYGISPVKIVGNTVFFYASDIPEIEKILKSVEAKKKFELDKNIEELSKKHPLVKDKRFFEESFFIDPMPLCFQED